MVRIPDDSETRHEQGTANGVAAITVRSAMVFLLIWGPGPEPGDVDRPPHSQQIVLLNP
ncbi:MAG: hypothetical protein P4L55_02795 [Syntrophobacteraceae bacterium]|nr:hypothetical protein [Syntrophobacteraceae bacterium]